MAAEVRLLRGDQLLAHGAALRTVYAEAFRVPPWHEDEERVAEFMVRLGDDIRRPGFTSAIALEGADVVGFTTGWTTPDPFPADRCYPQAAAGLGAERARSWLCGAREIDELAMRPTAQGAGIGAVLLAAMAAGAPNGRVWLLTSVRSAQAMGFYERQGWTQATHPSPDGKGVVVFLGPRHPARTLAVPRGGEVAAAREVWPVPGVHGPMHRG
ncbi:GNAT family N-acetyltransferase [Streptomyces sp. NPDC032198]|uniref:GNAT family N-acetyltransferase n=1 Tax=Streptomyces sp. NPDC032198 TaxID=3155127 RepID=UPI0034098C3B